MKKILLIIFILQINFFVKAEITYQEILKNPTDLELNIQYAKEQEKKGEYKSVIATLERLSSIYSDNLDLKLYLLSISLKIDSKERTKNILNDIKKSSQLTNKLRTRIEEIANSLENQEKQKTNSDWVRYLDVGANINFNNNVNTISDTKTLYISNTLSNFAANTVVKDDYQDLIIKTGAFKKLSETSNINFNIGKSFTNQNNDKNNEKDLHSLFINYNNNSGKNYSSIFYNLNEYNYLHQADLISHNLTLENRYNFKSNQNILISSNIGVSDYRTDSIFTTADTKNNQSYGLTLGYEYYFSQTHHIKYRIGMNDYDAKLDNYGYDNDYYSLTYSKGFKLINFSLSRSVNNNEYKKIDTFVKDDVIRDDEITTDTFSLNGNLDNLIKTKKFNFLKDIFYSASFSDIKSTSNILNYDYQKEIFKFGLTKRIMFWKQSYY